MVGALFDKYGGFGTVSRVVMAFYEKVLDSDKIGIHFENVDMPRLIDHQTKFIASVLGGPAAFSDERLRKVHTHLNLTHADFDAMTEILRETLQEFDFEEQDIRRVSAEIEARRPVIVSAEQS